MIITDYLRYPHDITWDYAAQLGITEGTVRLPEDNEFDVSNINHWKKICEDFGRFGIHPLIIEPMPNALHDHIKAGDKDRDWAIEKVISMFPIMEELRITTICFNFMAYVGWTRTNTNIKERGGAKVTEFSLKDYKPSNYTITESELWSNYKYFIEAVIPEAEKHGITLALHPDDPPISKMGNVSRIMISLDNIEYAVSKIIDSPNLGVTMCQSCFKLMDDDLDNTIKRFKDKIKFIHFRNIRGNKENFHETFHDNGILDMAHLISVYKNNGIDVPIRIDHVPTLAGEESKIDGYDSLGRLYASGYLKGLLEATTN